MPSLPVNTSTDGTVLVAAPGARQFIRVSGLDLTSASAVSVSLKSGDGTIVWGPTSAMNVTGGGGIVIPTDRNVTIDCKPGQSLLISLSASVAVQGNVQYEIFGQPPQPGQ